MLFWVILIAIIAIVVGATIVAVAIAGSSTYLYLSTKWIQPVSANNRYMNYGFWPDPLLTANQKLVDMVLEASGQAAKENNRVLDVGCGYGEQDHYLIQKLAAGSHITAIDINPLSVVPHPNITFKKMDALGIRQLQTQFDTVFCIESAFHYEDRPTFFKRVAAVLADDGVFAITDILLERMTPSGWFLKRLLKIPDANLVSVEAWKASMHDAGLEVVHHQDITQNTFAPYYRHLLTWPHALLMTTAQPFSYHLVVCRKTRPAAMAPSASHENPGTTGPT
jgi:cyclopropane fatty-acyl-phospholipid synthase-like methyltransferase